jgi:hypothetical protein
MLLGVKKHCEYDNYLSTHEGPCYPIPLCKDSNLLNVNI